MKMNIRAALKEKKMLDERIEKTAKEFHAIGFHTMDNPKIGLLSPEDFEEKIKADFQSLNALIARREAINKAILEANATITVEVPKFVSFTSTTEEMESITLANAINRKNYYATFLQSIVKSMDSTLRKDAADYKNFVSAIETKIRGILNQRFQGLQNVSQEKYSQVEKEEIEKYEVKLIDPLNAGLMIEPIYKKIENYLQTIDNVLSRATEMSELEIED